MSNIMNDNGEFYVTYYPDRVVLKQVDDAGKEVLMQFTDKQSLYNLCVEIITYMNEHKNMRYKNE